MSKQCCEGKIYSTPDGSFHILSDTSSRQPYQELEHTRYGDGVVTHTELSAPTTAAELSAIEVRVAALLMEQTGTIHAILVSQHTEDREPRPGDPLRPYNQSRLWHSTLSGTTWNSPTEIYASDWIADRGAFPTTARSVELVANRVVHSAISDNGNIVVAWNEYFAKQPSDAEVPTRYRMVKRVNGTWQRRLLQKRNSLV